MIKEINRSKYFSWQLLFSPFEMADKICELFYKAMQEDEVFVRFFVFLLLAV